MVSMGIYRSYDLQNVPKSSTAISEQLKLLLLPIGGGGGGANTKVPDMYGVGGCFRDPKHKSNMYTFVQQRGGGVSIFYPESQKYKWYFCTHIS